MLTPMYTLNVFCPQRNLYRSMRMYAGLSSPPPSLVDNIKLKASLSRKLAKHAHLPTPVPETVTVLLFLKERDKIKSSKRIGEEVSNEQYKAGRQISRAEKAKTQNIGKRRQIRPRAAWQQR